MKEGRRGEARKGGEWIEMCSSIKIKKLIKKEIMRFTGTCMELKSS